LNPRYAINVNTISNRAPSAAQPTLQFCAAEKQHIYHTQLAEKMQEPKPTFMKNHEDKGRRGGKSRK
jgi:hypothetical protein